MKTKIVSPFWVVLLLLIGFSNVEAQQVFKISPASDIGYMEYLPQGYQDNSDKYPLVIFLHGLGERGPNSTDPAVLETGVAKLVTHGPPKHAKNGTQFPFILLSPQLKNNFGDWPTWYVMEIINYAKTYLRVDEKRIYLTGLSLGGGGTWWVSQDNPKTFAAIAPVCGSRNTTSKACLIAAENVPVWAFHGDKDSTVPLSRSVNMVNAINACTPAPNPLAKMTIYPGVNHNSWDRAYATNNTYHTPNVYEWLMSYTNTINGGNVIPQANAGGDLSVTANSVSITATGSDSDGTIASYAWAQISGPNTATLTNGTTSRVTASNLISGTYTFRVRVTDNGGEGDSDYVTVRVTSGSNVAPVANAGADKTITLPTSSITLTGTGTDSDGTIASYAWTKVSGGAATLTNANTASLTASALVSGSYTFRLTVTDNGGSTHSDDVKVTVKAAANVAPVANAGADKSITLPTNSITLTGTGTDADGTIASYAWTKVSGGAATLTGATTATLVASALENGAYVFRLTVTDNGGATHTDDVNVTVSVAVTNTPPVADAGANRSVTLPVSYKIIAGTATDADGTIASYEWTKVSGPACTLSDATTARLKVADLNSGVYVFRFKVTDNLGATSEDEVSVNFNYSPVVSAGPDVTVELPTTALTLSGSATDEQGSIASYAWTKVSGPNVVLGDTKAATLSLSGLQEGTYSFQLSVKDNQGYKVVDNTTVTVNPVGYAQSQTSQARVACAEATTLSVETTEAAEPVETTEADVVAQKFDLNEWSTLQAAGYQVVIFNESGSRIYAGEWTEQSYQTVFSHRGLYYYNILQNGRRVDTGKLFIQM